MTNKSMIILFASMFPMSVMVNDVWNGSFVTGSLWALFTLACWVNVFAQTENA